MFCFCASPVVFSQNSSAPRTLLYFIDVSRQPTEQFIRDVIEQRLREEAEKLGFLVEDESIFVYQNVPDSAVNENGEVNSSSLRPRDFYSQIPNDDIDIMIATFFSLQGNALLIQFSLVDPVTDVGVGGLFTRGRAGLTLFSTVNDAVTELSSVLADYVDTRYVYVEQEGKVEEIFVESRQEQVAVFFAGREVGQISEGGLLIPYVPFQVGSNIRVEARKSGYHNWNSVVAMDSKNITMKVPALHKKHRFALQSYWTLGLTRGVGVAANFFLKPDRSYIQVYHHFHDANYTKSRYTVYNYDYGITYGHYLLVPPGGVFRFAIAFGAGVVRTTMNNTNVEDFEDFYLNLINPMFELNLGHFSFFTRAEFKYTLGIGKNLLGLTWIQTVENFPNISIGIQYKW